MIAIQETLTDLGFRPETIELVTRDMRAMRPRTQQDIHDGLFEAQAWTSKYAHVRALVLLEIEDMTPRRKDRILALVKKEAGASKTTLDRVLSDLRAEGRIRWIFPTARDERGHPARGTHWCFVKA